MFGIGAVIAMVAFGQGAQAAVKDVFASLGTNTLILSNAQGRSSQGPSAGGAGGASLTWDGITAIGTEVSTISAAVPVLESRGTQVVSENANWNTGITGTTAEWFKVRDWGARAVRRGHRSVEREGLRDRQDRRDAAVPDHEPGRSDDPDQQPAVRSPRRLTSKGQNPRGDSDDTIIIPLKAFQQKLDRSGAAKYMRGQVLIAMKEEGTTESTISKITSLLRDRHKLDSSDEDDFRIRNPAEFAKAQQASTERIATLLAIVAAVSLLVGGIGVMNIMLVSVIERTREIGIRMAVGAKPIDVMTQFLVEALLLAAIGGLLGLGLGYLAAWWGADFFGWKMFFPAATAGIAFGVSGGVGVVFGLYPAVRASQLDPITALRYES